MKTTYFWVGAAAVCGLALATPNPGQQAPVPQARAVAQASTQTHGAVTGPAFSRAAALAAIQSPDAVAGGPSHLRADALAAMRGTASGPVLVVARR